MARRLDIIYCGDGNKRFAEIAINSGFLYGARLPGTCHYPIYFADQDWKLPDRAKYVTAVKKHRPYIASVLDWEQWSQYCEVMAWAEDVAPYVNEVMIIVKIPNSIQSVPNVIGGKAVRIGYSVPTKYGGSTIGLEELQKHRVHLLGGSPHEQMRLYKLINNVVSVDGNYHQKVAINWNKVWEYGTAKRVLGKFRPLSEYVGGKVEKDAPYVAFELSSQNIMTAWRTMTK